MMDPEAFFNKFQELCKAEEEGRTTPENVADFFKAVSGKAPLESIMDIKPEPSAGQVVEMGIVYAPGIPPLNYRIVKEQ